MNLPPMPKPDLLVDCAQSMVHGLTISKAEAWGAACYAAGVSAVEDRLRQHDAEIEELKEELRVCCELKRAYQDRI